MAWYFGRSAADTMASSTQPTVTKQDPTTKEPPPPHAVEEKSEGYNKSSDLDSAQRPSAKIFISVSEEGATESNIAAAGKGGKGKDCPRQGVSSSASPRSAGALADYFSALFDESFCSHNFKLVG